MIKVANNKRPNLIAANLTLLRVVDVLVNMFVTAKVVLEMCACRTIRRHRVCGDERNKKCDDSEQALEEGKGKPSSQSNNGGYASVSCQPLLPVFLVNRYCLLTTVLFHT